MACDFHDLQNRDLQGFTALYTIRNLCTKYNVNESNILVSAQCIIEDEIPSILSVAEQTSKLADTKKTCRTSRRRCETEVSCLPETLRNILYCTKETADTMAHVSSVVISLAPILKKLHNETRHVSGKYRKQLSIEKTRSSDLRPLSDRMTCTMPYSIIKS